MNHVILKQAEGKVIPFKENIDIPFKKPLVKSAQGINFEGIESGIRSVIVKVNNEIYKLKGVTPDTKKTHCSDGFTPFGCQVKSASINELNTTEILLDYSCEKNVSAPFEPVGYFQYNLVHEVTDEKLCASILRLNPKLKWDFNSIDKRLENFPFGCLRKEYDKGKRNIENVKKEFNKLAQWVGFWYGGLENNNLAWGVTYRNGLMDTNVHKENVLLYPAESGLIAAAVDFDGVEKGNDSKFELRLLEGILRPYDIVTYVFENLEGPVKVNYVDLFHLIAWKENSRLLMFILLILLMHFRYILIPLFLA